MPDDETLRTPPAAPAAGPLLRGTAVSPGLVLGPIHRKDYELARRPSERVARDAVESELNRFRAALEESRRQLTDLRTRVTGEVAEDDARILDTHLTYLKDSAFIADVEALILGDQMRLENALGKVIGDFDRIFRLVASDALRQSAVDLRDVGLRVLRNLDQRVAAEGGADTPPEEYVLAARELSIVDMFNLSNDKVLGIVTEEGGLTSHAAIFARSMRIPTVAGIPDLLDTVREGDFVILDASEGTLRVNPDELVRRQFALEGRAPAAAALEGDAANPWADQRPRTHDGEVLALAASCGNLPEVEQAGTAGIHDVGLYRTELLYLVDRREQPSRDALIRHYQSVVEKADGGIVTFRLLDVDSGLEIAYLHPQREPNPRLGRVGVRALLAREDVLRRQLQALLVAGERGEVRIALPFVTDCGELRQVREMLFEERLELRKEGQGFREHVEVGIVVETPAALLGMRDLAREADFLTVNLDSLMQHVLAADRDSREQAHRFEGVHPFVLRALRKLVGVCTANGRDLSVFGATAQVPANLALFVGVGLRSFCVGPAALREFLEAVAGLDSGAATRLAERHEKHSCASESRSLVSDYYHGYAGPAG